MRIFYDGYIYDFQQFGGINRYFNEIISRLPSDCTPIISTYLGAREFWPSHSQRRVVRSRPFARTPALAFLGRAWLNARTATISADLFHPTYYALLTPRNRPRHPLVVTVHDMIHEIFAGQPGLSAAVRKAKQSSIEHADAILCNSENTRRDLIARFPKSEAKSFVTPLASSMTVDLARARAESGLAIPYFLYVGGRESYKNFGTLLTAWSQFSARHPGFQLRVVGGAWQPGEKNRIAELSIDDSVILQQKVSDDTLAILYHRSIALIYPSLYEGFGIPPLEAMRCGTAVICSDSSSLPEVGGDASLYFEPTNAEELCAQMATLVFSSELRAECIRRGSIRSALFSWENTAALTFEIYQRLCRA